MPQIIPQLVCRNLTLGYEGRQVVSNLSFTVDRGDYLCVVGENGSGKSTLMKTVLRLKSPMSGELIIDKDLKQNEIGYLPQQTASQKDFPASVREVVLSGCLNRLGKRAFYGKAEKRSAEENMQTLGISALANRCYRELSGGQQQRALLARALCAARKLLLLDEPASGLDPLVAAEMYLLIAGLNKQGMTVIMISHDVAAAVKYASHVLHIGNGESHFFGTAADYLKSAAGQKYAEVNDA